MLRLSLRSIGTLLPIVAVLSCGRRSAGAPPLFRLLSQAQTGVTFANTITTSDSVNVQTNVYLYNGAGVAVGDIDNDGLPDIFFAGNMVSSRLYLNKGNMRFQDITQSAGVMTNRWATGVTMVDINNDGYLDIYVSVSGPPWSKPEERANQLFINNGDHTFTEAAARYGIADTGFTTHAVFFDYNGDGYLDLFLLNDSPKDFVRTGHPAGIRSTTLGGSNRLYRNNGDGTFTDVSGEAGILKDVGYGLGVAVADLNGDGFLIDLPPDVAHVNAGRGSAFSQLDLRAAKVFRFGESSSDSRSRTTSSRTMFCTSITGMGRSPTRPPHGSSMRVLRAWASISRISIMTVGPTSCRWT